MSVSYKPLWKQLIDKGIKKGELASMIGVSLATITKMGKGGHISTETIEKICLNLHCKIEDVLEFYDNENKDE